MPALSLAPNPVNAAGCAIHFRVADRAIAALRIVDLAGRTIRRFVPGELPLGDHAVVWDACDDAGRAVSSGLYWVWIETPGGAAARKVCVLR